MANILTTEDYDTTFECHIQSIDSILLEVSVSLMDADIQSILPPQIMAESQTFFNKFRNELSTKTSTDFLFALTNSNKLDSDDDNDNDNDLDRIKQQLRIMDTGKDILDQITKSAIIIANIFKNNEKSLKNNLITLDIAFARFCVLSKFVSIYLINIGKSHVPEYMIENLNNIHINGIYETIIDSMLMMTDKQYQYLSNINTFNRFATYIHNAVHKNFKMRVPQEILLIISQYSYFYWNDFMILCMKTFAVILDEKQRKLTESSLLYSTLWHKLYNIKYLLTFNDHNNNNNNNNNDNEFDISLFSNECDNYSYIIPLKCIMKVMKDPGKDNKFIIEYIKTMILELHVKNNDFQGILAFICSHCQNEKKWSELLDIIINYSNCSYFVFKSFFIFKNGYFESKFYKTFGVLFTKILSNKDIAKNDIIDSIFNRILPLIHENNECLFGILYCLSYCIEIDGVCKIIELYGDTMLFLVDDSSDDCNIKYYSIVLNQLQTVKTHLTQKNNININNFYQQFRNKMQNNKSNTNKNVSCKRNNTDNNLPKLKRARYL